MQLAVKDLQDTIQYMHKNRKYKRVSRLYQVTISPESIR